MEIGERLQIPDDGYGNPVREFDRKKRQYTDRLQWFEVEAINPIRLKPIWPR